MCPKKEHRNFERVFKNVYPSELQLRKENISTSKVSPLDFSIITESKKVKIQSGNKRDEFPFSVVCTSDMDNNVPSNIYYASKSSEFLRFARTNSEMHSFLTLSIRHLQRKQK